MKNFLLTLASVLLISCQQEAVNPVDNTPNLRAVTNQEKELVSDNNSFAVQLIRNIGVEKPGNFFVSPISVGYALGMTMNGSAGATKEAFSKVLGFEGLSEQEYNQAFHDLTTFLLSLDKKVQINIANSIWYKDNLQLNPQFDQLSREYFSAEVNSLNFAKPEAPETINTWIENATEGKIRDMIEQIPPDVVMYLVNAIYFKAAWTYQFDKNATVQAPFYQDQQQEVQVNMMKSPAAEIRYLQKDNFRLIDIPYGNKQYSMTIIQPDSRNTQDFLAELTPEDLDVWVNQANSGTTVLHLPKFRFEYKITLNEILSAMGLAVAFAPGADFSKMFSDEMSLVINRILHQSFLEVNEEGTEAAAATVVEMKLTSAPVDQVPPVVRVDSPFIFLIREKHSNTILFAGALQNPAGL